MLFYEKELNKDREVTNLMSLHSLSQISCDFARHRRECNWYKVIYKGKFEIGVPIYALKLQVTDLRKFRNPPHATPLPSLTAYISECFVIHIPSYKNDALCETIRRQGR